MDSCYEERQHALYRWMDSENIAMVMLEDSEAHRDPAVRWLTGHHADALVFLVADQRCILVAWDEHLAAKHGHADRIVAYNEFGRDPISAVRTIADMLKLPVGSRIEIPDITPYPVFLQYVETLRDWDVLCRREGVRDYISARRAIKDEKEIAIYRKVSAITNDIIDRVQAEFERGKPISETDIALFIDAEGRKRGCEGCGFETLAAGSARSFAIHAFPNYTNAPIGDKGLSILDFGLKYKGYSSDVTLTIARGPLSPAQNRLVTLVQKAHDQAMARIKDGMAARELAIYVDSFFEKSKKTMPHGLGHGIGLEAHEQPFLRSRADNAWRLEQGMIFTVEPGLYDPRQGGCRLENDVLIGPKGPEILTKSRIIKL